MISKNTKKKLYFLGNSIYLVDMNIYDFFDLGRAYEHK